MSRGGRPVPAAWRGFRHGLLLAAVLWLGAGWATLLAQAAAAPEPPRPVLIRNATVLDPVAGRRDATDVLLENHRITAVGRGLDAPDGARIVAGDGRWVTPGLIDIHTHLGMAGVPYIPVELETWDVNELSDPNTAQVRAEDAVDPGDPAFARALAGGVTTVQVLPGSANLIGGRGVVLRNIPAVTVAEMTFDGAARVLKMACGENPKYTWGPKGEAPVTRMGIAAELRHAFAEAAAYRDRGGPADGQAPDARLEVLAGVLAGDIPVHMHCYRAAEMDRMMTLAEEFGFRIAAFHHAAEAYKIADRLAAHGACAVVWADVWGFKMETLDAIVENAAYTDAAGACVALHSDLPRIGERLPVEAARARAAGMRAGLDISRARALSWLTTVPAAMLGIDDRVGRLEAGLDADVVVWNGDPFSIRTRAERVFIRGVEVHALDDSGPARSDLELGHPAAEPRP